MAHYMLINYSMGFSIFFIPEEYFDKGFEIKTDVKFEKKYVD